MKPQEKVWLRRILESVYSKCWKFLQITRVENSLMVVWLTLDGSWKSYSFLFLDAIRSGQCGFSAHGTPSSPSAVHNNNNKCKL